MRSVWVRRCGQPWEALGSHCPRSRSSEETHMGSFLDPTLCLQLTLVCNFLFEFFDLSY